MIIFAKGNNHTRKKQTIAQNVRLNLGGGASATVNLHLNEEGFLLIEGLGAEDLEFSIEMHDKNLSEIQILSLCELED